MALEAIIESRVGCTSPLVITLITVVVSLVVFYWWQQSKRFHKMGNQIPGPPALPFIGNLHYGIGRNHNEIMELAIRLSKQFGNVARIWLANKLVVFLTHPADIEIILNSQVHLEKSDEYRFFKPWLGDGLLISKGDIWRRHRKLIAPAFHQNVLKSFMSTFYSNSKVLVEKMYKEIGKEFDVHIYLSEATVDILLETSMGITRTAQENRGFDYAMAVMKMCDIIHKRTYHLLYRIDSFFNLTALKKQEEQLLDTIHGLTKRVIKLKNELYDKTYKDGEVPQPSLQEIISNAYDTSLTETVPQSGGLRDDLDEIDENDVGEKRRLAFLDLMVETAKTGANLGTDEIKDEVNTIMFEGHDTTAAGSSFILCVLGIHQDIQHKVYNEIHDIFEKSDRPPTFADTLEMKYLERVILETLRLYPPVPLIARKLNEDVRLVSEDYTLPKGCTVAIGTFKVHRRGDIYANPDVFDPDNFLPERTQNRHYYSFIPFSAGPRSCVGRKYAMLKLKVLISTILRNYKITSKVKEEEFKLQSDIILKRTDGFRIFIEPRIQVAS